jgi:threonine 3-dehydrogenase
MARPEKDTKDKPGTKKKKTTTTRSTKAAKALEPRPVNRKQTTKAAMLARNGRAESADVREDMWALVYDTKKDSWDKSKGLRKDRVPKPELEERKYPLDAAQVVLKVLYTGVCGSDSGIWFRTSFKDMIFDSLAAEGKTTRIVGHEILGKVVEAGSVARARYGIEEGDIVSCESHIICGLCHQCLIGQTHVCVNEKILGITTDGGFAEYIKLPARVLWRTDPKKIRKEVGAIQEPFGNAVHACTAADLRGKNVAVFGTGAIGQFVILIARALGAARIIGVEPDPNNAKLALELGADDVIQFTPKKNNGWHADTDVVEAIRDLVGGDGVDVGMEMAGFNSSVNNVLQSVRRGGEVVLFGIRGGDFHIEDFSRVIVKGLTIRNVIGRRIFETWEITRNLLESKDNRIQKKIWEIMLKKGKGTILDINKFSPDMFEKKITTHPKILVKW